jgi:hypothetical protein
MDRGEEMLERAIETLRALPEMRSESTARVIIAASADRQRRRDAELASIRSRPRWWVWGAVAAAVMASLSQLEITPPRSAERAGISVADAAARPVAALTASSADMANAPRPVQLVLSAPRARSVRVVGDFNGWDSRRSPMVRDDASGLWNVSLMLRPGRHVYAFVVNNTEWVRDPRATAAPDADFGRPGSVMLVGRP